jgi:hypothetical protein
MDLDNSQQQLHANKAPHVALSIDELLIRP